MEAQFSQTDGMYLSNMTLSLLKDTGWYTNVDLTYS